MNVIFLSLPLSLRHSIYNPLTHSVIHVNMNTSYKPIHTVNPLYRLLGPQKSPQNKVCVLIMLHNNVKGKEKVKATISLRKFDTKWWYQLLHNTKTFFFFFFDNHLFVKTVLWLFHSLLLSLQLTALIHLTNLLIEQTNQDFSTTYWLLNRL